MQACPPDSTHAGTGKNTPACVYKKSKNKRVGPHQGEFRAQTFRFLWEPQAALICTRGTWGSLSLPPTYLSFSTLLHTLTGPGSTDGNGNGAACGTQTRYQLIPVEMSGQAPSLYCRPYRYQSLICSTLKDVAVFPVSSGDTEHKRTCLDLLMKQFTNGNNIYRVEVNLIENVKG